MVKFYGKIDINKHGNISSALPAWSMQTKIEELTESVESAERQIERGEVPYDKMGEVKEKIRKGKEKLEMILSSKPALSEEQENKLWKIYKSLGKDIQDSLFTRSEMKLGLASPHEELKRMKEPIIRISPEIAEICKENNVKVSSKSNTHYVSRDGASLMWKVIGKYFGEASNVETLRKDKVSVKASG